MGTIPLTLRAAASADVAALQELIARSVRDLSPGYYSPAQVDAALEHVFGVDTQLIEDGTYYVIESQSALAAAGGWSARLSHYGGDQAKRGEDRKLDPSTEPARIRAFFVHPDWARQGLARRLLAQCESAARTAGFRRFVLVATLPGEPFYRALGFVRGDPLAVPLPDGASLPCVIMERDIEYPPAAHA